ncbi:MAG: methyltransferase domain-containing protein [Gammaproteobacteria bacterium]|nr:methyltransferase domain-containing protein [Gammaproteobacteria bacterium]
MSNRVHQGTTAGTHWDPGQYLRFGDHRLRPALELLARVPSDAPVLVHDLGCGAGNVTRHLAARWPEAKVVGVDNSAQMLEKAGSEPSNIGWVQADLRTWRPDQTPDVLYSNATLQWLDNHGELIPRLFGFLSSGGCFAIQMPLSWDSPSHQLMHQTLKDGDNGGPIGQPEVHASLERRWVQDAAYYYALLAEHGAVNIDVWETEYLQVLSGDDPVLEWVKATGLRPVLNSLSPAERDIYVATYGARLREAYPKLPDGSTLYPFRRLFMVATAP